MLREGYGYEIVVQAETEFPVSIGYWDIVRSNWLRLTRNITARFGLTMDIIKETVYHGTTTARAQSISQGGFIHSNKDIEWLGHGIYFFQYAVDAKWWAELQSKQCPEVIKADIEYTEKQLLNLDDSEQLEDLSDFYRKVLRIAKDETDLQTKFPTNDKKVLCAACNTYRKFHPDIAVTKYTFSKARSGYLYHQNQLQVCITENEVVKRLSYLEV